VADGGRSVILEDLSSQSQALAEGRITSAALTDAVLAEVARRNPRLNAYLHIDADGARAAARASDARRSAGRGFGPLDGLTLGVKDNIDVAGMPTTAGMATRRGRVASADAFVVERLRAAGMVLVGKLNMHEAALGTSNANPHYGRCENPLREGFTPGGSSGGSACAVAAGLCALALGTDTMGSVRVPAAFCGVVGFKGSYGAVSTRGTVACSYALDHVGPIVRSQRDLALVWPAIAAFDAACADARRVLAPSEAVPQYVTASNLGALGVAPGVQQAFTAALERLRRQGAHIAAIDLAGYDFGLARRAGLLTVEADLLHEHAADWREQPHHFSPELAKLLQWAERQSAAAYATARRTVVLANVEVQRWWQHGQVMLLPTTPLVAHAFDEVTPPNVADLTAIANMAGVPALTVPLPVNRDGAGSDLPTALQAIAPYGSDTALLRLNLRGATDTS
jgi:Asp-tRNA(Asn)/Glu-tRNA(Gln) amidotransferase A subunit family amidase